MGRRDRALGNAIAVRHGGRRASRWRTREDSELFIAWATDLGGISKLTAGQRAVLRRVAEADAVCATAFDYLRRTRQTLTNDRVGKALAVLAAHAATVYRGAGLLGL